MSHRHLIGELLSWGFTALVLAVLAINYPAIRKTVGEALLARAPIHAPAKAATATGRGVEEEPVRSGDTVELQADRAGHFAAALEVNGRSVDALVDTGATLVMLTYEDAERAGVAPRRSDFTMRMQTANGVSKVAPVQIDRLSLGSITVRNVEAGIAEPGMLRTNLLGMAFLKRLARFEVRSGRLILQE